MTPNTRRADIVARCLVTEDEMRDDELKAHLALLRRNESYHAYVNGFVDWFEASFKPPPVDRWPRTRRAAVFVALYMAIEAVVAAHRLMDRQGLLLPISFNTVVVGACASYTLIHLTRRTPMARGMWPVLVVTAILFSVDTFVARREFSEFKWVVVTVAVISATTTRATAVVAVYCVLLYKHPMIGAILRYEDCLPAGNGFAAAYLYFFLHAVPETYFTIRGHGRVRMLGWSLCMQALTAATVAVDATAPFEEPLAYFVIRAAPLVVLTHYAAARPAVDIDAFARNNEEALARLEWTARYVRFYIKTAGFRFTPRTTTISINRPFDFPALAIQLKSKLAEPEPEPPMPREGPRRPATCEICSSQIDVDFYDSCSHLWAVCSECLESKFGKVCPVCDSPLVYTGECV